MQLPFYKYGSNAQRIWDISPSSAILLSSGTVTLANWKCSAVNGTAFVDFSTANVLTDYIGNYIRVKDSSGRVIQGYIKAAGTGAEGLSDELIVNGDCSADSFNKGADTTYDAVNDEYDFNTAGFTYMSQDVKEIGKLYKSIYTVKNYVSGSFFPSTSNGDNTGVVRTAAGTYTDYGTGTHNQSFYLIAQPGVGSIDDVSFKKVLIPGVTGVTIVDQKDGAIFNWESKDANFKYSDVGGYTYKIYSSDIIGNNHGIVTAGVVNPAQPFLAPYDKVTNGIFGADSDWIKGGGGTPWGIGAGKASKAAGTTGDLEQDVTVTANTWYFLKYDMTFTAGTLTPQIGGVNGPTPTSSGTYIDIVKTSSTGNLKFQASLLFAGTVDNVIVKDITGFTSIGWLLKPKTSVITIADFPEVGNAWKELTVLVWQFHVDCDYTVDMIAHWDDGPANQRSWGLSYKMNNKFGVWLSNDGATVNKNYTSSLKGWDYGWYLTGFTWNNGTLKLYANGILDPNPTKTIDNAMTTLHDSTADITIGCDLNAGALSSNSKMVIGEGIIYNRVLSDQEIRNYYERTQHIYN